MRQINLTNNSDLSYNEKAASSLHIMHMDVGSCASCPTMRQHLARNKEAVPAVMHEAFWPIIPSV